MDRNHARSVEPIGKQVAAAFLVRAWEAVSTAVLDEAWALYEEVEENEESINPFSFLTQFMMMWL
jgi:hypothetical protein